MTFINIICFGFLDQHMYSSKRLDKWIIIVSQRDAANVDGFVRAMINVGRPLGFGVSQPMEV